MDNTTGQFGAGGSAPENQGQEKVNPMSPSFASSAPPTPTPPPPITPPTGGYPTPTSPPVPTAPSPSPPSASAPSPVPPPPPKEVNIRTMMSDQESLKSSGGVGITSASVKPPTPIAIDAKKVDSATKPIKKQLSGNKKALLIGLGIVVFLGIAAAAVVNFVLPTFFSNEVGVTEPEEAPLVEEEPTLPTPTIPTYVHQSYFIEPVDSEVELMTKEVNTAGIQDALTLIAADVVDEEKTLTEFSVTTGGEGIPVSAREYIEALLPDITVAVPLEDDFTGFFYSDGENVWPGYILSLNSGEDDINLLRQVLNGDIENSEFLKNLFLEDQGAPKTETFNDGSAEGDLTGVRYLSYEKGGSINYGWKEGKLVISTSYAGFKKVSTLVGEKIATIENDVTP